MLIGVDDHDQMIDLKAFKNIDSVIHLNKNE